MCAKRHKRPHARRAVAVAVLMLAGGPAVAAMDCSTSVPTLAFGTYDPTLATPTDVSSSMTVTCTRVPFDTFTVSYTISLSTGGSGSYATRRMASGASQLNYNVYTNAARSQVWGNGSSSTGVVGATMNFVLFQFSQSVTHTAYGRVPAGQNANPGTYSDNLVVTLTF
ncbi:MAG: spore coat U domain-containing protein [Steroidobacteraceae bacterium]